eukprot:2844239-Amphidinium_carterae.1
MPIITTVFTRAPNRAFCRHDYFAQEAQRGRDCHRFVCAMGNLHCGLHHYVFLPSIYTARVKRKKETSKKTVVAPKFSHHRKATTTGKKCRTAVPKRSTTSKQWMLARCCQPWIGGLLHVQKLWTVSPGEQLVC